MLASPELNQFVETFVVNKDNIDLHTTDMDRIVTCSNCKSPVCKALVINNNKNKACNHLECIVCNNQVCGFEHCGSAFKTNQECYAHMTDVHGGWYDVNHSEIYTIESDYDSDY